MKMNKPLRKVLNVVTILFGVLLNAIGVDFFTEPHGVMLGGSAGVGRIFNHLTPLSISQGVLICNIVLLILAWKFLGKKFVASIILASLTFPLFLDLITRFGYDGRPLLKDPLLASIVGGALMGLGIGMILRVGASFGGSDVMPLIMHKQFGTNISGFMYVQDCAILLFQIMYADLEKLVLGIIVILIYTFVINKVLLTGRGVVQFEIYSSKKDEICAELIRIGMGATLMHGTSGYLHKEMDMIKSVTTARHTIQVKKLILDIDPEAFITITMVQEVNGRGFTIMDPAKTDGGNLK